MAVASAGVGGLGVAVGWRGSGGGGVGGGGVGVCGRTSGDGGGGPRS